MEYFNDDSIVLKEDIVFDDQLDAYDIPYIYKEDIKPPKFMGEYTSRDVDNWKDGAMHFFLDDARFNAVWSKPEEALKKFQRLGVETVLSPDFSLYSDYPMAMQIWNTYRNRVVGAYWQMHGIQVIPSISWSDERSYDFAFNGVERGSIVAVSNVGVSKMNNKQVNRAWLVGFKQMLKVIEPSLVLCYGYMDERHKSLANIVDYPTRWHGIVNKQVAKGRVVARGLFDYDELERG